MTACTSFLAFFAEQTLAFAVKMHSRPDRWPQIVRFASGRADSLANRRFVNDLRGCEKTFGFFTAPLFLSPKGGMIGCLEAFWPILRAASGNIDRQPCRIGNILGALAKKWLTKVARMPRRFGQEHRGRLRVEGILRVQAESA